MAEQIQNQKNSVKRTSSKRPTQGRYQEDDVSRFAITIGKPVEEVFEFWRDFKNLATFMKDVKEIQVSSSKKSHWVVELKNGLKAEWDAEITAERANQMIAWKSLEGSNVKTSGSVWFAPAPAGQGTVVSLVIDYEVPGGKLTEMAARFTGEDGETLIQVNLRRLKALLETGDIPTIEGQSSGRGEDAPSTNFKH